VSALRGVRAETWVATAAVLAALIAIPLMTDTFTTYQFALVGVYAIALIGLNLLTGYSGQISLGNGAFMAFGGYTTALLAVRVGIPAPATIPLAGLVAGAAGVLFGIPALRLSGIYLALATFALALALPPLINNYDKLTGGNGGINLQAMRAPIWIQLSNEQYQFYFCWAIAGLLFLFARLVMRSGAGRALMALRDSETAAVASGVNVAFYKTLAFGLSAAYAGVAGALLAIVTAFVHPDNFSLALSIALLTAAVIGGLGLDLGPLLGGVVLVWLPYLAEKTSGLRLGPLTVPGKPDVLYGIGLILIVFLAPSGVAGLLQRVAVALRRRRTGRDPHGPGELPVSASSPLEQESGS
jgi:branched-chain amino acid transport system permease protein